jgi:hypothetical protein
MREIPKCSRDNFQMGIDNFRKIIRKFQKNGAAG